MLSQTPPMGFNTWNTFGNNISDEMIRQTADAMVDKGLLEAGYKYLVIDDCWSERQRDPITDKIVPDKNKFPHGMKAVSDYVHSKGLKFGMYSCAGVRTCGDFPGSFDHEFLDAETFAEYGCDFLKYDFCYKPGNSAGPLLYYRMGMALKSCGREILFSACNWGSDDVGRWIRSAGAHMYRSTGDINDSFQSFKDIALSQVGNLCYSAPGCYNDIDMLTVGMYGKGNVAAGGCNDTDYKTEFALWCMFSSPLMLGCDIRSISDAAQKIVTNKEMIKINQDSEARPAFAVGGHPWDKDKKVFMKHLSDNEYALGFFNLGEGDGNVCVYPYDCGLTANSGYAFELTDVLTGKNEGRYTDYISFFVPKHDCKIFRVKVVKL
jgi:Alpha-galactosidase